MEGNGKGCILVSGGAGFIGSHVGVELIESGYGLIVADNMSNCDMKGIEGLKAITGRTDIPFFRMDFCDKDSTMRLFKEHRIDAVIHFAGYKAVGESVSDPLKYYSNNLQSLMNLMECARKGGCGNILFSSSATVYGEPSVLPVTEETPRQEAASPYGNTKRICEDILRDSTRAYPELKGISLRYFNPIGAHPSALIGELPRGVPNNLVPYITQTAIGKRECLSIFGDDYPTPDGTCQRDFIDVVDLAKAHVCAVERMLSGKMEEDYEVYNIGTGEPLSVMQLVDCFQKATGVALSYRFAPRREGDIAAIWADPSKANEKLGWKAGRDILDTLKCAWAWEQHLSELQ